MTKAQKYAVETFPHDTFQGEEGDSLRFACMLGYYKGLKDSALIPEDMGVIFNLVRKCQSRFGSGDAAYEEALKLFNKARENEQA